jgi:hypothetical protein
MGMPVSMVVETMGMAAVRMVGHPLDITRNGVAPHAREEQRTSSGGREATTGTIGTLRRNSIDFNSTPTDNYKGPVLLRKCMQEQGFRQ